MADGPGLKRPGLRQVGNNLAIDLVNTRVALDSPSGSLRNADNVLAFLLENSALARSQAIAARKGLRDAGARRRFLQETIALRNAIAGILEKIAAARQAARTDVAVVNAVLKSDSGYEELRRSDGARYALTFHRSHAGVMQGLAPIARAAAELLAEGRPPVRKCANAECIRWFYDTSRTKRRRWCEMAICGNRAKVSAFQRRQRPARRS